MEWHARTWFTPRQKAELWERWKSGQCVADIARALERRNKSGVYRVLALNGGIAPAPRQRARGSNENTNGLLRQYCPRGTDLSRFSQAYLNRIALRLNQRPRKTLGFEAPADRLQTVLQ